ncbi:alpha/beta hydrolase-fold protein [Gramella lutea]|uniref:Alpha/beta hydrolase-fold protein n=1 Tax=Christiangramia lutea TaxID=1607951 RepID=A0A9X1V3S7_9FLAO|nr:alpha/beta hydrolase-fold protein [Christiangramia lutea]MCH4823624.1 alpha/beta hydrolase-fold protein [Christiangramia lutea]
MKLKFAFFLLSLFIFQYSHAQSTASKNISTFDIEAAQLDTVKKIWLYLPHSYKNSDKQYPVIYMHDAQNLFDNKTSFVGEWQVDEKLDSIGEPEAIIVGIEHGGENRINELTPYPHEKYGGGNADSYLEFIVYDLKPHIDKTYRTQPGPENTGIFGSSLGGLVSFYAALKYPDTFSKIGVYSPSFWFNEKIYEYVKNAELNLNSKFYFLAGTAESEEMLPDVDRMVKILKEKGINSSNIKKSFIEGGEHNEALWKSNFAETYLWLMK